MMYQVQAQVLKKDEKGFSVIVEVPTFYLNSSVQGIVDSAHACSIATQMLIDLSGSLQVYPTVTPVFQAEDVTYDRR